MNGNRKAKLPTPNVGCVTGSSAAVARPRKFCVPPGSLCLMSAENANPKKKLLALGTYEVRQAGQKGEVGG